MALNYFYKGFTVATSLTSPSDFASITAYVDLGVIMGEFGYSFYKTVVTCIGSDAQTPYAMAPAEP